MEKEEILKSLKELTPKGPKIFTHLHLHTSYSFLDGFNDPHDSAKRAKELGMSAMAITDHNHLGGAIDFQQACRKEGIKPLLGVELYWTEDTDILSMPVKERTEWAIKRAEDAGVEVPKGKGIKKKDIKDIIAPYEYDTKQYHILFIAMNQEGWKNLTILQSEAAKKCTYNGRYLIDNKLLEKYNEGLLLSTACVSSPVNSLFIKGEDEKAIAILSEWHRIFKDRLYVEIQPLDLDLQWISNVKLIKWAKESGVRIVATNDVHYTRKEDHDDHDTLLCIGTGKFKDETERMIYSNDYWIKSYDEMVESFANQISTMVKEDFEGKEHFDIQTYMKAAIEGVENSNDIPAMCEDIKLGSDKPLFPKIDVPFGMSSESYLTHKCYKALYKYKNKNPEIDIKVYEKRLEEELSIINPKGFAPYMLIVEEYINWANDNGCPTGPGRGSAAGSLVLFLLGITKMIDPIKYNLLFFRFLTADRSSPPDIDTDFDYDNRHKVIEHLEDLYGQSHVAHIGTYSYMGVKSSLKDVGRVLRVDFGVMNTITKRMGEIIDSPSPKFKDYDKLKDTNHGLYKEFKALESEHEEVFRLARRFEGTPRNLGVHASGLLVTPMPINEIVPTRQSKDGTIVTLFTGTQLEDLNFIKFDILGLKTISVIKNTIKSINEDLSMEDLYRSIDLKDDKMFEMIREKETDGLFQIESNLFKGMIGEILPDSLNDIIVITSLGRPGPLSAGMDKAYARRKHGAEKAIEPLPNTWDIVKDSLGTICYQEQCMLIAQRVAGFNGNQSDSYLRKALAKKDAEKMELCRRWLIYGKINKEAPEGYDETNANQVFYDPAGRHGAPIKGGINNEYDEAQLTAFWKSLEGYANYLFNLSHAACYSYITILTAYLKRHYPVEFMAALMSAEKTEEKLDRYIGVSKKMGIPVESPDINLSGINFTPQKNKILFGLGSIKGVGESSIPDLITLRPYSSIEDALTRVPRKSLNKRVGMALIKSGAFDYDNPNRHAEINRFYDFRKDKDERLDIDEYTPETCIEMEREILGSPITYTPWWNGIKEGKTVERKMKLKSIREITDKGGRLMAFATFVEGGTNINAVIFSKTYAKSANLIDPLSDQEIVVRGKKDDKGTLVVSSIKGDVGAKPKPELYAVQF